MNQVRIWPRGFCVTQQRSPAVEAIPHFEFREVGGVEVAYDSVVELDVAESTDAWVLVLGHAWALSSGPAVASETLAGQLLGIFLKQGTGGVEEALYDIAGRYAVILGRGDRIEYAYNDACGTRTVYYNVERNEVASHFEMLDRLAPATSTGEPYGKAIRLERMLDMTANTAVKALIPNHRINFKTGKQERFFGDSPNRMNDVPPAERIEIVERLWHEQLDLIVQASEGRPIAFSMTGGKDSRTSLAMARHHKQHFTTFTYTSANARAGLPPEDAWGKSATLDHDIVMKMLEFLPDGHRFIEKSSKYIQWAQTNKATFDRNSTRSHGRWIVGGYLEQFTDPRTIHYRGNLQEIGRFYAGPSKLEPVDRFARLMSFRNKLSAADTKRHDDYVRAGYVEWKYPEVEPHYDIGDIWYWEHRHGRWYAEVLNETDAAFDTISPMNCRRILDCYLAFPQDARAAAVVQQELIHRNHPVLSFFGMNKQEDLYEEHVLPTLPGF